MRHCGRCRRQRLSFPPGPSDGQAESCRFVLRIKTEKRACVYWLNFTCLVSRVTGQVTIHTISTEFADLEGTVTLTTFRTSPLDDTQWMKANTNSVGNAKSKSTVIG